MAQERTVMRAGGICAMLGAVVTLVSIMLGPMDLDSSDTAVVMQYFAHNAGRLQVHGLGVTVGKLLMLSGFVALYTSLQTNGWARLGLAGAVVMTVINVIGPMMGGAVLPAIGQAYGHLATAEAAAALPAAQGFYYFYEALLAPSLLTMAAALLPFATAILQSDRYPTWLGWLGLMAGIWVMMGGAAFFLVGPAGVADVMIFFVPGFMLSIVWLLIAGFYLWHGHARLRGGDESAAT